MLKLSIRQRTGCENAGDETVREGRGQVSGEKVRKFADESKKEKKFVEKSSVSSPRNRCISDSKWVLTQNPWD